MNDPVCNICQLEDCLTHYGVLTYYWNQHQDYKYYQEHLDNQKRKQSGLGTLASSFKPKSHTFTDNF